MIDNKSTDMIKTVTDIIEEVRNEMCRDYCKYVKECNAFYNFAWKRIAEQPTVYDIDSVMKQLEKASCYIEDGCGHAGHLIFTDDAIEIVKRGGAE